MKYFVEPKNYCGNLPRHKFGVNKGNVDRLAVSKLYGFTVEQLKKAYLNWQDVFRIEGSTLTYEQYLDKLSETDITPNHVGNLPNQYNLSRYGDIGSYTNKNCRFILRLDNEREQSHPSLPKKTFICLHCSKSFLVRSEGSRIRKFCSRNCMGFHNQPSKHRKRKEQNMTST